MCVLHCWAPAGAERSHSRFMADRASRTRRQTRRAGATSVSSASGEGWRTRTRCCRLPQLAALRPEILPLRLMRTAEVKSVQSLLTDSLASSLQGRDSCGSQRLTVFLTQPHCRCALLSAARWTVAPTRTQLKAFFRPLRFLQFHSFSSGEQFPGTGKLVDAGQEYPYVTLPAAKSSPSFE